MTKVPFVIYSEEMETAETLVRLVDSTADGEVVAVANRPEDLRKHVQQIQPCAVLAHLGGAPHATLDALDELQAADAVLYVCGPQDDSSLLLRALKLGAKEYFPPEPLLTELDGAIEAHRADLADRLRARGPQGAAAHVLAVMGAKGGVGATFVACELAASLQALGRRAAVVDLNCPLGDAALHFDLRPRYTLASVANECEQLDATFVRSLLETHRSGLRILAAPEQVEENELVRARHVEQVLTHLRSEVDWIVVDVSRSWNEASVGALDLADEILLVTSFDLAALAHTRQHLDLLYRLGHPEGKIHVLANRRCPNDAVTDSDFKKFVGRPVDVALPNDYATAVECSNGGRTLGECAPKSALTRAFQNLARDVHRWRRVELEDQAKDSGNGLSGRMRRLLGR